MHGSGNYSLLLEAPLAKNFTYYLNVKNYYNSISHYHITLSASGAGETSSYYYRPVYLPVAYFNEASPPAISTKLNIDEAMPCELAAGQGTWFSITLQ